MTELNKIADYVNQMLQNYSPASDRLPVSSDNIVEQMHDGALLCCLANAISTEKGQIIDPKTIKFSKATLFHKMDNVNRSLDAFKSLNIPLINIRAEFIVEKKEKSLLGLFNQITKQKPIPQKQEQQNNKEEIQQQKLENQNNQEIQTQDPKYEESQQIQLKDEKEEQFVVETAQKAEIQQSSNVEPQQKNLDPVEQEQKFEEHEASKNSEIFINKNPFRNQAAENGYLFEEILGNSLLVLCGSLRKQSCNLGIVKGLQSIKNKQFFDGMHFQHVDLSILPLFNEDLIRQSRIPKAVFDLKQEIKKVSGILIVTPQYNQCVSPIIKNALDWVTLTEDSVLTQKKFGVMGTSYIDESAIHDVIKICKNNGANLFDHIFYINLKSKAFSQAGEISSDEQIDKLSLWYQDFSHFVLSDKEKPEPIPRFIE